MKALVFLIPLIGAVCAVSSLKISNALTNSLEHKESSFNIMISFVGGNANIVNWIESQSFPSRTERINTLKNSLQGQADLSQQNVKALLTQKKVSFQSFWISNKISVKGASRDLIQELSALPEVALVDEERIIYLEDSEVVVEKPSSRNQPSLGWGIDKIQAPDAWRITNGSGVIVATIDRGVRHTHETLRHNHRVDYGWFDPYDGSSSPIDITGHGTHTMGTIAGSGGIGVAPGVNWIACRGCGATGICDEAALIACGQWALCPTKPDGRDEDCSKAPALVSNSWGGRGNDTWYEPVTEAWVAAGIIPIFAIGNDGPLCASTDSPGDLRRVIGVGSTDSNDAISDFSSRGPTIAFTRLKPEISAPGEAIISAGNNDDNDYTSKSGTSMASPHIAGVTALLLSIDPNLTFAGVRNALIAGVDRNLTSKNEICENRSDIVFPNYHFGFGRINALKVVEAAVAAKAKLA